MVQPLGHLRTGIHASKTQLRVGAHLGCFPTLGHQALSQTDHDGVVLGQFPGEIPEGFTHGVSGYGVGIFLHLIEAGLV